MANPSPQVSIAFPEKLQCLFVPKRFKVLWGGRAAGRSWGCARALLLLGAQKPIRVLCAREYQNSISESVHKLLSDQIDAMGLNGVYEIFKDRIVSRPGAVPGGNVNSQTSFVFEGIKSNTQKIKSYEGINYCWVEEAIKVSKASWEILTPTIREPGSEIWMTFNPELEEDYTYKRFVLQADPATTFVVKMTYRDNPFVNSLIVAEAEEMKKRDLDAYLNVWEGNCRQNLDGAVYAKELRKATLEKRITRVPWHRESPVDTFWDLGRADRTAVWFAQRVGMEFRILAYFEDSGEDIGYYLRHCQSRPYTYGNFFLPHDAKAKRLGSKRTIQEMVEAAYPGKTRIVKKLSVVDGINAARVIFSNC